MKENIYEITTSDLRPPRNDNAVSMRGHEDAYSRPLREKSALTLTLSHGRADLRTDGAKRVRIARNLSRWHVSAKGETFRAWSKSKTGSNSMRADVSSRIAGEGLLKNVTSLPSNPHTLRASKRSGFTLAEVLITLAIVGVVAAITLPPLITNIQNQIKVKRVQNIKQKFSKATDKMLAMSGMNGYGSTENFVEELKHHLKIAKVCDNDHLTECWGYEKVKLKDGKEWNIADTKVGKNLKMKDSDTAEWANTVGIVTADGTPMILSYNKKCDMTTNINPQWTTDQSSSTDCIAAIFDWNGGTKPNKFIGDITSKDFTKADVISFNANGLGPECVLKINGKCYGEAFKAADYSAAIDRCGGEEKILFWKDAEKLALMLYKKDDGTTPTNIDQLRDSSNGFKLQEAEASALGLNFSGYLVIGTESHDDYERWSYVYVVRLFEDEIDLDTWKYKNFYTFCAE